MLSLAVFGVAVVFAPAQQSVTVIPQSEAPFTIVRSDMDRQHQPDLIPAIPSDRAGIFLIRDPRIVSSIFDDAVANLKDVRVSAIVRRESENRIAAWTANGKSISMKVCDVPDVVIQAMKDGELAIEVEHERSGALSAHRGFVYQPVQSKYERQDGAVLTWTLLGKPTAEFVSIRTSARTIYNLGNLGVEVGSKAELDGRTFTVVSREDSKSEWSNSHVTVALSRTEPGEDYTMSIAVGGAAGRGRDAFSFTSHSSRIANISAGKTTCSYTVSCNSDREFWDHIRISKYVNLTGFIGRIPTKPNTNP